MYNLPHFKEHDRDAVIDFMRRHSFAMVIGSDGDVPVATQLPLLIDLEGDDIILTGHYMTNTDHARAFEKNRKMLCIFHGADAYVSAGLYTNPKTASTWNYMSVHARGEMEFTDHEGLLEILKKTTDHYEHPGSPAAYDQLPVEYVERLAKAVVGFKMVVQQLDNVFKLSQNRDRESYGRIIRDLEVKDAGAKVIADEMKKREAGLF